MACGSLRNLWWLILFLPAIAARMTRTEAMKELGLPHKFDDKSLKAAYRKRSLAAHPDKGGSTQEFLRVSEAFEVLSDAGGGGFDFSGGGSRQRQRRGAGSADGGAPVDEEEMMRRAEEMFDSVFDEFLETMSKGGTGGTTARAHARSPPLSMICAGLAGAALIHSAM